MKNLEPTAVILAGGAGTHLWPLSRQTYPKQLPSLSGSASLLQDTACRLNGLGTACDHIGVGKPIVVCGEDRRSLILEQLLDSGHEPQPILLEPASRNTAPALKALSDGDENGNVLIGDAYCQGTKNGLVLAGKRLVVAVGLENPGQVTLEVVEVQSGSYLGEDDIVRFEDIYNRAG